MGCNSCKDNKSAENLAVYNNADKLDSNENRGPVFALFAFTIKLFLYFVTMLISPLILLFIWYILFKTIILNKDQINMMPFLISVGSKLGIGRKKIDYDNDDDYEDLDVNNPDEYELAEMVDEIKY